MTSPDATPDRSEWRPRDALKALFWWLAAGIVAYSMVLPGDVSTGELFGFVFPVQSFGAIASVTWMARTRLPWREALAIRIAWADWTGLLIGAGLQIGLALALVVIIETLFRGSLPDQYVVEVASVAIGPMEKFMVMLSLVVIGPVAEELLFRGVLLRSLLVRQGARRAVWWSAIGFAALHLLDPNAMMVTPALVVLGVVLGREVVRTGRLGRAVAIHAGFNLVTVVALFAIGSG